MRKVKWCFNVILLVAICFVNESSASEGERDQIRRRLEVIEERITANPDNSDDLKLRENLRQ
jgi:hypothetical protein